MGQKHIHDLLVGSDGREHGFEDFSLIKCFLDFIVSLVMQSNLNISYTDGARKFHL